MAKTFKNKIAEYKEYLLFFLAVVQIVGIIVASYLTSKLAPISQDIAVLQTEVKANNEAHENLVQKDSFDVVVERINHISSRVDQIYSLIIK